jgi:hypothetical protein
MGSFPEHSPKQASQAEPTIGEIKWWDEDKLVKWIQQKRPNLLTGEDVKKLKTGRISGLAFLLAVDHKVESFENGCKLRIGASLELTNLAREIIGEKDPSIIHQPRTFVVLFTLIYITAANALWADIIGPGRP